MQKKIYNIPQTEVTILSTAEIMQVSSGSDRPTEPGLAPKRQPEVF